MTAAEESANRKRSPASHVTTPAKITPPRLGECLDRQRLFHRLDQFRGKPALWISGPAGCGKTMLAASYLKAAGVSHLWYQIDARDADTATLFYYLGLAAKQKLTGRRKPLPLLTPEYFGGLKAFTRNFFEALYEQIKPPFALVFDNYQDLEDDVSFGQVVRDAVEVMPHGGQVILISRNAPSKMLARLQLHQDMAMLGWEDLQLTLDEVKGLANILHKNELPDEQVAALRAKTLGWTAGVVLLLTQSRKAPLVVNDDSLSAPEFVFDYFAGEILAELDHTTREFLIKSAFLPQISPATARSLTGNKNAGAILADLVGRNYFTYQCSHGKKPLYQYHPLFGEFLREQAQVVMDQKDFLDLQRCAAGILLENGLHEAGAKLLQVTAEWDRLLRLICDQAPFLVSRGRFGTVQEWLNYLPEEMFMNTPWLLYWLAVCRMPFEPAESHKLLEKAYALFKQEGDLHGVFLSWSGAVDAIHFNMVELGQLDYWIDEVEGLRKIHQRFPSLEIETRVTTSMLRSLVWRQPQNPRIKYWEKRAVFLWEHLSDLNSRLQLGPILIQHYYFLGKLKEAMDIIKPLERLARSDNAHPLTKIVARLMNGYYHWPLGNNASVMQWADEALELANQTGIHVLDCLILGINIFAALCSGKKDAADSLLDKMAQVLEQRIQNTDTAFYYFLLSWRTGLEKENAPALDHAVKAVKIVMQHGAVIPEALCRYALAWSLFSQGKVKPAHANLQKVLSTAAAIKSSLLKFSCLVTQAYFFLREDRRQIGLEVLKQAFSLGRERGFEQIFYWRPETMVFLCTAALNHDIEISYARHLIRQRQLSPSDPAVEVKQWPWAIKIFTLGRFEVILDDKSIDAEPTQKESLMLLKALIAYGGFKVKEERLFEELWPGVNEDTARAALNTALHRLRKLIGHEDAVTLEDGRLSLNFRQCWVDLAALDHCLNAAVAAEGADPSENAPTLQHLARKILEMYQGHFLPDEDAQWVIGIRNRLQTKTLQALKAIGAHLETREQWPQAAELYERATEIDPVAEVLYQGMMRCHARSGRPANVLAAYKKWHERISCMLGVEPSAQSEALRKRIMRAETPPKGGSPLTPKETEVLNWIAQGKSTWDVSAILGISERTVKFHVTNILQKLDAVTRAHAVAIALEQGLVEIE